MPGTNVMIFKIFSPKKLRKNWGVLTQTKAKLWKNLIIALVFEKNANFFAENCRKSQKIVIITSTPALVFTQVLIVTGAVIAAVLESLEPVDQQVQDLLPGLGGQVVEVRKDTAHSRQSVDQSETME
jgi:hypothetical protein